METTCTQCNTPVTVSPSRSKAKKIHCSKKCAGKSTSETTNKKKSIKCEVCGVCIKMKQSALKRYKGPRTCSRKCRGIFLATQYLGTNNPNSKYTSELDKFLHTRAKDVKHRANLKKIECTITGEDLIKLYNSQNGLCYYSGIPLKLGSDSFVISGQADLDTLSVDRLDSTLGYVPDNIVLCCNGMNKLKGNASVKSVIDFIKNIAIKSINTCTLNIKKVRSNAILPVRANLGDGGYDIFASKVEHTGNQIKVYSGISCSPSLGWVLFLLPRSSICKKNIRLANSVGLLDNGYTGEIIMVFDKLTEDASVTIGEKLCQIVPIRTPFIEIQEVMELSDTKRGNGGLGSTS